MQVVFGAQFQQDALHEGEEEHIDREEKKGIGLIFFQIFKYEAVLIAVEQVVYGDQEEYYDQDPYFEQRKYVIFPLGGRYADDQQEGV